VIFVPVIAAYVAFAIFVGKTLKRAGE